MPSASRVLPLTVLPGKAIDFEFYDAENTRNILQIQKYFFKSTLQPQGELAAPQGVLDAPQGVLDEPQGVR